MEAHIKFLVTHKSSAFVMIMSLLFQGLFGEVLYSINSKLVIKGFQWSKLTNYSLYFTLYSRWNNGKYLTVLGCWRPRSLNSKGSQVTISPPSVDHRRGINTSSHRRIRVPKGNLQCEFVVHDYLKSSKHCILHEERKKTDTWTGSQNV